MVERDAVLDAWDEMFNAAQRVETALPFQMSEAIASLEAARKNMSTVLQSWATTSEASLQRQLSEAQTLELEHQATIRHLKAERDDYLNKAFLADLDRQAAEAEVARLREITDLARNLFFGKCSRRSKRFIAVLWDGPEGLYALSEKIAALQGEPSVPLNEQALVEALDALQGEPKP